MKDGFTAAELAEGQRGLLSFRRLGRAQDSGAGRRAVEQPGSSAAISTEIGRGGRGAGGADGADQVNAALRKYLQPGRFVGGYAGDFPL